MWGLLEVWKFGILTLCLVSCRTDYKALLQYGNIQKWFKTTQQWTANQRTISAIWTQGYEDVSFPMIYEGDMRHLDQVLQIIYNQSLAVKQDPQEKL